MDDYVMEKCLIWPDNPDDEFEKIEHPRDKLEELTKQVGEYKLTQSQL
jgi:hypothetical protein